MRLANVRPETIYGERRGWRDNENHYNWMTKDHQVSGLMPKLPTHHSACPLCVVVYW